MKDIVKVAAVQMDIAWLDPRRNLEKMEQFITTISAANPIDLIIFPELANTGYIRERNWDFGLPLMNVSEKIPGPFTDRLCQLAKGQHVNVCVGFCEIHPTIPGTLYNSGVFISRDGKILAVHHKVHIPAEEKHYFYPGNTLSVFPSDVGTIGLSICADNRFPEYGRILALKGAEIVCALYNMPDTPLCSSSLPDIERLASVRALENVNYFIGCDRTGEQESLKFKGKSAIAAPTGEIIGVSKTNNEEVVFAELTNNLLLSDRVYNPIFRDRRPELYSALCEGF